MSANNLLLEKALEHAVCVKVFDGYSAGDTSEFTQSLIRSKDQLYSPEAANALARECAQPAGVSYPDSDSAFGLLRVSGTAGREDSDRPAAMGVAHVALQARRGRDSELGDVMKLHLEIRAAHVHRMGVGLGLHSMIADAVCAQVLAVVQRFQRTAMYDTHITWAIDTSFAACSEFGLKEKLHAALVAHIYEPLLEITEDSIA